jgi:hypothetical protein
MAGSAGLLFMLALAGCGTTTELIGITDVSPHVGNATHDKGQNTVQYTATGIFGDGYGYGSCCFTTGPITDARWKTSDPVNTTINKNGLATCLGPTVAPVKITASVSDDYGNFSGSAVLACE